MDIKEVTLNDVFRYGFGGFLLVLVAACIDPCLTKSTIESLGELMAPLAAFALGGTIYAFYRAMPSEVIFWISLIHSEHWKETCKYHYIADQLELDERAHVHNWKWYRLYEARRVFRLIRDKGTAFGARDIKRQFHREHSELHSIYLSGFIAFLAAVWCWVEFGFLTGSPVFHAWWFWFIISIVCIELGVLNDVALSRRELLHLKINQANWRQTCLNANIKLKDDGGQNT